MIAGKLWLIFRVLPYLGWVNVVRVFLYRLMLRTGLKRFGFRSSLEAIEGPFFPKTIRRAAPAGEHEDLMAEVEAMFRGELRFFSFHCRQVGKKPDWFIGQEKKQSSQHWTRISEFAGEEDIKVSWEPSRFDWTHKLARAWQVSGEDRYLILLEDWLSDWCRHNPRNIGPNWKCGQEASLRVFNLLLTHYFLGEPEPSPNLTSLLVQHCQRIEGNLSYALAQDNNHGTSETAALLLVGALLSGRVAQADRWLRLGSRLFEGRVKRLVGSSGNFSQASTNYHRVFLDTVSLLTFFQKRWGLPGFGKKTKQKLHAAADWLFQMTDEETGGVPNLGGNDGARLLPFGAYRDFRPSIQLARSLLHGHAPYPRGAGSGILAWFGLDPKPRDTEWKRDTWLLTGGYVTFKRGLTWGLLRAAHYRFRPAHADGLHFDLWHRGHNILRDTGSYSYFHKARHYHFSGTSAHNTMTCDGHDQMPRLGRFLFGKWLRYRPKIPMIDTGSIFWNGELVDARGCRHERAVLFTEGDVRVMDIISGFQAEAMLRWHLIPADWRLEDGVCSSSYGQISISSEHGPFTVTLEKTTESLHYLDATEIPVLVVRSAAPPEFALTTRIQLG